MQYVKPKIHDETNYYEGVDLNNKEAVEKEFKKRRATHTFFTLIFIVMFCALGLVAFDYYRVYELKGKPILALKEESLGGTLYKGIGYQVLYCENDERYIGAVLYNTCTDSGNEVKTLDTMLYDNFVTYIKKKKLINDDFVDIKINSKVFDENNDQGGTDYLFDVSVECKNDKQCFSTTKSLNNYNEFKVIVRFDQYNDVYDLVYFKTSGAYYDTLVQNYENKVKQYLVNNSLLDESRLKDFKVTLLNNKGKIEVKNVIYSDSYKIQISYTCNDGSNTCVKAIDNTDDEGDYSNLSFMASMFLNDKDEVSLVGPKEYLN